MLILGFTHAYLLALLILSAGYPADIQQRISSKRRQSALRPHIFNNISVGKGRDGRKV